MKEMKEKQDDDYSTNAHVTILSPLSTLESFVEQHWSISFSSKGLSISVGTLPPPPLVPPPLLALASTSPALDANNSSSITNPLLMYPEGMYDLRAAVVPSPTSSAGCCCPALSACCCRPGLHAAVVLSGGPRPDVALPGGLRPAVALPCPRAAVALPCPLTTLVGITLVGIIARRW